ncbi:efflux RND transporter periplasmic adaptor subunit [Bacteroides oleiciplenus]|uniref:Efflux transporter, RND family, MFP subunit n=2 Tax=Bacteroides oleiciplenus TaxID=626931 RepID=K9EKD8_9BACE|nr:efflux RND transporter periplasmic adaptor subunit [Bacteroides oleiciplenus]EKU89625.1 efflux transporter, RND family, MFP subunit [Bacteroides oleiciplenus YIT 12058]RGN40206.1 efflux RND transporter periplasmic adaptor subunit [Bacteroides oleiciplenus]
MKRLYYAMALLFPLALVGCRQGEGKQNSTVSPVKVKVAQVSTSEAGSTGRFSGTVEEANGTSLSFAVMGTVNTVHIGLGDRVAKGQLIATINPLSMQSAYDAAKAALGQAEDAYRRMKELYDKGSLPEIKWVEVQSKLQQAKSMEEVARKSLEDCKLYAPFSGIISEKLVEVGQNVIPGVPVARLVTANLLKVKIAVPETEIAAITTGQQAVITVPALGGRSFKGTVVEKGIVANPLSRSYDVKMRVDNGDKELMPGMVTEVVLAEVGKEALYIIPVHIVQLDEKNNSFVWVNDAGKASKRILKCGEFAAEGVTVVSGLNEGDEIIVEGQQKVCEGTPVLL